MYGNVSSAKALVNLVRGPNRHIHEPDLWRRKGEPRRNHERKNRMQIIDSLGRNLATDGGSSALLMNNIGWLLRG